MKITFLWIELLIYDRDSKQNYIWLYEIHNFTV